MAETRKQRPADVLRDARSRDSAVKRSRVFKTLEKMEREGLAITFAAVAREAGVSNWLVYAEGVREHILTARDAQLAAPAKAKRLGRTASEASLRADLALSRENNRHLREEVNRLKTALRQSLGTQIENESAVGLRARVDELTKANQRHRSENSDLQTRCDGLTEKLSMCEEDLSAARRSLRRMIKERTGQLQDGDSG